MGYTVPMNELRWTYRVGRVLLLPLFIVLGMQYAQGHQPVRDNSAIMQVEVPTCTAPAQGTLPTGVILLRATGYVEVHSDPVVGKALDQLFGNGHSHLIVIGFCA